jgi:hypothetical protein
LIGTSCGFFGCDKYIVDYGQVSASSTDENCLDFVPKYSKLWTAAETANGPTYNYEDSKSVLSGQKPAIRISCQNTVASCDFLTPTFYVEWDRRAASTSSSAASTSPPAGDTYRPTMDLVDISPRSFTGEGQRITATARLRDTGGSHLKYATLLRSFVTTSCTAATYNRCSKNHVETIVSPSNNDGPWTITLTHILRINPGTQVLFSIVAGDHDGNTVDSGPINVGRSSADTITITTTPTVGGGGSGECFALGTKITYKSKEYWLDELRENSECVIPHIIETRGVCIMAYGHPHVPCLTLDHLVRTPDGYVKARYLTKNDIIFLKDDKTTKITQLRPVEKMKFFGLNCLESTVLADGIQTSTFGHFHYIPSIWMALVGKISSIETASSLGDNIVSMFHKWL